jgi:cation:H+ antiporter
MTYILFVIGFVILIKGADMLVSGSSSIAQEVKD